MPWYNSGSTSGGGSGSKASSQGWSTPYLLWKELEDDIRNFSLSNDSPYTVIKANYFSAYNNKLVIISKHFPSSFSFGFIGLKANQKTSKTLNHEYGHTLQWDKKGMVKYIFDVAIPSLTICMLAERKLLPYDYFSYPFEAEADSLGGINRLYNNPIPEGEYNYWDLFFLLVGDVCSNLDMSYYDVFAYWPKGVRPVF